MKLDKKQVPQLAVLGLMLLGCIGFISFQLSSGGSKPAPAPVKQAKAVASATPVPENQAVQLVSGMVFPNLSLPIPRRDPFAPMDKTLLPEDPSAPKPVPAASHKVPRFKRPNPFTNSMSVPPLSIAPIGQSSSVSASAVPGSEPVKDPAFQLTGVIRGTENVAIIRSGQSRYVVKQGAVVEGHYRVISISQDSIMLDNQGRLLRVKLGGD